MTEASDSSSSAPTPTRQEAVASAAVPAVFADVGLGEHCKAFDFGDEGNNYG